MSIGIDHSPEICAERGSGLTDYVIEIDEVS
jgi:hypothetical protein